MSALDVDRDRPAAWAFGFVDGVRDAASDAPFVQRRVAICLFASREDRRAYLHGYASGLSHVEGGAKPLNADPPAPVVWDEHGHARIGEWDVYIQPIGVRHQWYARKPGNVRTGETHVSVEDARAAAMRAIRGEKMQ